VQNLTSIGLVAFGAALIVSAGYHVLVARASLRRLAKTLEAHDVLLGGGSQKATDRIVALERDASENAGARAEFTRRLSALEAIAASEVPRVGFVRYNAFPDVGSDLSFALALLNKNGDGVVISSLWSREETRTYGKAVNAFSSLQDASNEELAAISKARSATS
jgi:hypothetical protein